MSTETIPDVPTRSAPATQTKMFGRRPFKLWMIFFLLLTTVLSLWRLNAADLMLDEGISYWIARRPLLEVISYSLSRAWEHPPLYYVMLHVWMRLVGDSEFALRALSWLGILLAVTVIATLTRRWFDERIALLVVGIAATNPMMVRHARDARMYPWLMALVPLSAYLLDRALLRNRWRDWIWFLLAVGVAISMHYLSALILLCYAIFLMISWRRLPPSRTRFAGIFVVFMGLGVVALLLLNGPRASVSAGIDAFLHTPRTFGPLWDIFAEWTAGSSAVNLPLSLVAPPTLLVWGLAVVGIALLNRLQPRSFLNLRVLLALLVFLPPIIAVFVMPFSNARHTSASIGLFVMAVGLGIAVLYKISRPLGLGLLVALLVLNLGLSARHIAAAARPFATMMDYVNARARDGEPVVYTYYFDWPFDSYYNRRGLPYFNAVPERHQDVTDAVVQERVEAVVATGAPSFWLMLFPGPENTDRVERAFNKLAFPAERTWFPSGRSVIHYFTPRPLIEHAGDINWGDRIRLTRWGIDSTTVAAGDALRLSFQWQRIRPMDMSHTLALTLVGPDGSVWARQAAVPCNGRCSTEGWTDAPVSDKLALYVPPEVPPGDYRLNLAWLTSEGEPLIGQSDADPTERVELPLTVVRVDPPRDPIPAAPFLSRQIGETLREGLKLRSVEFGDPHVRGGANLLAPLQLEVTEAQPELEVQLWLKGDGGEVSINQPLGPTWYPTSVWEPGRILQVRPQFAIPGTLPPGEYRASLTIKAPAAEDVGPPIAIGTVVVEDRPRRFDMPEQGVAFPAECDEGIRLARFELPEDGRADSSVPMTLTWQAGGPTQRNWKVFIHLQDGENNTVAQGDGYPASGAALTPSWAPGEVIVDRHELFLPAGLPHGDYAVRIGFYEETTGERLRCGAGDSLILPSPLRLGAK